MFFRVRPFSPFYAPQVAEQGSWKSATAEEKLQAGYSEIPLNYDVAFGKKVQHEPVLIAVDLMFAVWFLLALVRNIKRDPNYYEVYSPLQTLAFAIFINLLFVTFFLWRSSGPIDSQAYLLTLNIGVFFCLGLGLIRNRERLRRILRAREGAGPSWLDVTWPAPLLIGGTLAAGLLIVAGFAVGRDPRVEWDSNLAVFRSLFFVAWMVRDMQYLQWMGLRRGKHSLAIGVLFLVIFYVCVNVVMATFGWYTLAARVPFSAFFVPSPVYLLGPAAWALRPAVWVAAFVAQWILIAAFIWLQQKTIAELNSSAKVSVSNPAPAYQ
jgi:hypothetical protein